MRAVSILIRSNTAGPEFLLRSLRVLPANSDIFRMAMTGDLNEEKSYLVGQEKVVRFLLDQGADVELEADNGSSVVERAWYANIISTEGLLLPQNYVLRHIDLEGFAETQQYSTLHKIVLGLSSLDLESQPATSTADIEIPDTRARTPLWWVAARGDENAVRIWLAYGASVHAKSDNSARPLHVAKTAAVARVLLEAGAKVDDRDNVGRTPFHVCAYRADYRYGSSDLLCVLLDYGADINARSGAGHTALHYTAMYGSLEHVTVLLDRGADMEARRKDGHTTLMEAIRCSRLEVIQHLLQNGADFMAVSAQGQTILHLSAASSDFDTINLLIASKLRGLDVDCRDARGLTCREYLQNRLDITETLQIAFEELLRSILEDDDEVGDEWQDCLEHLAGK